MNIIKYCSDYIFKKLYFPVFSFFLLVGINQNIVYAQSKCSKSLLEAQDAYSNGRLKEVYSHLKSCLTNGFTKAEQVEAYRLLTITYIYLEESKKAEESILNLIKIFPEYQIDSNKDPIEFIDLFHSFRTLPVFATTFKLGLNVNSIQVINGYSTDNLILANAKYNSKIGFHLGVDFDVPVYQNLYGGMGFYFLNRSYKYQSTLNDFVILDYKEKQNILEIPIAAKYRFQMDKYNFFASGGISLSLLQSAKAIVQKQSLDGTSEDIQSAEFDMKDLRNSFMLSAIGGVGMAYYIGRDYIQLEVRYHHNLSQMTKKNELDYNSELSYQFGYIDNDLRLSNITISVGYTHPIYKPKKLSK